MVCELEYMNMSPLNYRVCYATECITSNEAVTWRTIVYKNDASQGKLYCIGLYPPCFLYFGSFASLQVFCIEFSI